MNKLTIITPSYNRAYVLPDLFESLKNQTDKNFEWIIVDDGSTDSTPDLVSSWINEKPNFKITYIKQENAGKMQAHNTAVINCKTDYFMCVDSDDCLCNNAVEILNESINEIENLPKVAGVIAYRGKRGNEKEKLTKYSFPNTKFTKSFALYENGFKGDTSILLKTDIVKQYLFPKIEGEKFVPEEWLYCHIDQNYDFMLLDKILILCEYLADGYTKNSLNFTINNIKGYCMNLDFKIGVVKKFKTKFFSMVRYVAFAKLANYKQAFKNSSHKFLYFMAWPAAFLYYLRKKLVKTK